MDLIQFATKLITPQNKNKQAAKELLPPLQKTRSYSDNKPNNLEVSPMLIPYKFGEDRGDWIMKYYVQWPMGYSNWKNITDAQMKTFANEFLQNNSKNNDAKYSIISRADKNYVIYQFDIDRWLKDNFNTSPTYRPPISLEFKIKVLLPGFMYIHAPLNDFILFIENKFKIYIRDNKSRLNSAHFRFLKKITPDLFTYKLDIQKNHILCSVKYSVIMGALFLYTVYQHRKSLNPNQIDSIKNKVLKFGDVSKLDKFLRMVK